MRSIRAALMLSALLLVATPAAAAELTRLDSDLSIDYSARSDRFVGTLSSEQAGTEIGEDCVQGRRVVVFEERRRSDRRIGSDATDARGRWAVRARPGRGAYHATVEPKRFVHSPAYGEVETIACTQATAGERVGRNHRRSSSVLGLRVKPGTEPIPNTLGSSTEALPATGASGAATWTIVGLLLIAIGVWVAKPYRFERDGAHLDRRSDQEFS